MTCNDLELQKKGDNENFPSESKHIDVDELRKAAATGCSACWTLLEGINKSKVSLDGIDHVTLNKLSAHSTLVMIIGDNGAWTNNTYLEFYTKIGKHLSGVSGIGSNGLFQAYPPNGLLLVQPEMSLKTRHLKIASSWLKLGYMNALIVTLDVEGAWWKGGNFLPDYYMSDLKIQIRSSLLPIS